MQRDKFTCKLCKDTETTLNVHHKYYEQGKEPWEYPMNALVTLCEHCHHEISIITKQSEYPYEAFKIYKSHGWSDKSRIMFVYYDLQVKMRIYDISNNYIIGYTLGIEECQIIIKLLKNAAKGF